MKICFLVSDISNNGGVERVLSRIANGLSVHNNVCIYTYNEEKQNHRVYYPFLDSIKVFYLNKFYDGQNVFQKVIRVLCKKYGIVLNDHLTMNSIYSKTRIGELESIIEENKFDVIIALQGTLSMLLCLLNKEKTGSTRLFGWVHNTFEAYFETPNMYNYGEYIFFRKYLNKLDSLVTLTKYDENMYKKQFMVNSNCIYNPLSFDSIAEKQKKDKNLIFVARIQKQQKGLDFLVKILSSIFANPKSREWKCYIVGDGPDLSELKHMTEDAGILTKVIFTGNTDQVRDYYEKSSILISTSRWEGFGLVLTEAMACGLPVVSFNNIGPSEIITDGYNGYLIDKYDVESFSKSVIELMENECLYQTFSKNALKRAEDFKLEVIVNQWEKLINGESLTE